MQLTNLARSPASRELPPEPTLPAFHKLSHKELAAIAADYLRAQETAVFKFFVEMVANRAMDPDVLGATRGSLAREIRGLQMMRAEFEGPVEDDIPPVDPDVPAGGRAEPHDG